MKKTIAPLYLLNLLAVVAAGHAADIKQSKVTQVVNDVQIISAVGQTEKNAAVNDVFNIPDVLRTGPASRAELVAQDDTVTRVGANTIFSFDPASRTIDLQQGSLLFHSPHGKGGGSIHTGSATASVLGSTLIVSATPNGGFKVISLEDGTDIKLPNGKHQHLDPGQLTYILPGSSELAPVVLFRLDDLILHSLLVKGFDQQLPSITLIDNEINKQDKLIKSGKVTDTGLLAGDNATADQVEVLDANTVQTAMNSQGVQTALAADATISSPSLTDGKIPVPPARIFMNPPFALSGNSFFAGQTFRGFAAHNIFFNPPAAGLNPLTVDLSAYAAKPEFDFVARDNLDFQGSVTFGGLSSRNTFTLNAGNQIIFTPGVTVTANVGDFKLSAAGDITLENVNINNDSGTAEFNSGTVINLDDSTTVNSSGHLTLTAVNAVNIIDKNAGEGLGVSDTTITTDAGSGSATLGASGALTVSGTSIQAHFLTLNSGDSILLDASGKTLGATGTGATANFTAPNLVTVNNASLTSYQLLNFAANTLVFVNDSFGLGAINLATLDGTYAPGINQNNPVVFGKANFISGNTWNGKLIRDDSVALSSGQVHISDTSFHISKLP